MCLPVELTLPECLETSTLIKGLEFTTQPPVIWNEKGKPLPIYHSSIFSFSELMMQALAALFLLRCLGAKNYYPRYVKLFGHNFFILIRNFYFLKDDILVHLAWWLALQAQV